MNEKEEATALWKEIRAMQEDLEDMKVKREALAHHIEQLKVLSKELKNGHEQVEQMRADVEEALGGTQ